MEVISMKQLFAFIAGVLVGGIVALLMAPMSGEELRRQIQAEADAELKRVDAEWQKILKQVNETVEETQKELRSYIEQVQAGRSVSTEGEPEAKA